MVQPYYNWMTGAAFASEDLELIFPGDKYLMHSGEVKDWPIDKSKRNLSLYRNNNFGGHKSYHVVGSWKNFFGGYYHNDDTDLAIGLIMMKCQVKNYGCGLYQIWEDLGGSPYR